MIFKYPIAIGLSPNTQNDDIGKALEIMLQLWSWKEGSKIGKAEKWFADYLKVKDAVSFNSGRSALYALLKVFDIGEGDEVIVQAFTCVAVPDPIIWVGAKPIFVDIEETLNIDPKLIEKHITPKTKAIVVQHTFGIPAKIDLIKKITQKHNLILIEDCAHSLGAEYKGRKIGNFGDAAFFSFGRDKIISSVFGGMAVINEKLNPSADGQRSKLRYFQKQLRYPSYFWIFQQLLHPVVFALILPSYNIYIGKVILWLLFKLHLVTKPVIAEELSGDKPSFFPAKFPNALAQILLLQLKKLDKYNELRRENAAYYYQQLKKKKNIKLPKLNHEGIYLRFNILTERAADILQKAKQHRILLGNWYKNTIDPKGVNLSKIGYRKDSCPKAEAAAKLSVNLPTYSRLTKADLDAVVNML